MLRANVIKTAILSVTCLATVGILACSRGDTAGNSESVADAESSGDPFVADGGAGSTLTIDAPSTIAIGSRIGFRVTAIDPSGKPLQFIKIVCDSELGIAITEPNTGVEHTGPDGSMSGQIGGARPGSYILECRAPQGFNLVDRVSIVVTGEGAAAFDGAAGGTLGGGRIEETPDIDDRGGVRISSVGVTDTGASGAGVAIDLVRDLDCDNKDSTVDPEPFGIATFSLTISNPSAQRIFVDDVGVTVAQNTTLRSLVELATCEAAAGGTVTCSGPFADFSGGGKSLAGSGVAFTSGTSNVTFTIRGVDESGNSFTSTAGTSLVFGDFNRCS